MIVIFKCVNDIRVEILRNVDLKFKLIYEQVNKVEYIFTINIISR